MNPHTLDTAKGRRVLVVSLAVGAAGVIAAIICGFVDLRRLLFSYLAAWTTAVYLCVGALIFLLTCHAMRAGWPIAVRRLNEMVVAAFPLLALGFIPVVAGHRMLFPWGHPQEFAEHVQRNLEHRAPYLNVGFFFVRAVIYFAIWIALSAALRRWSFEQDREDRPDVSRRMHVLSSFALPVVALTIIFSSIDWLMALEVDWRSTMFPVYVFGSGFVGAVALLTALTYAAHSAGLLPALDGSHYYALGRLLLAFTIFWAYAAFFQLMLIWIANIPEEAVFFIERWHGPWKGESIALFFTRFAFPFILLMPYGIKRRPRQLTWMAILIIVSTYLDFHWLVVPAMRGSVFSPLNICDVVTVALVGGLSTAFAVWRHGARPVVPLHDPRLAEAFAYRSV